MNQQRETMKVSLTIETPGIYFLKIKVNRTSGLYKLSQQYSVNNLTDKKQYL